MPDEIRVRLLIDNDCVKRIGGTMKTVTFAKKRAPPRVSMVWERIPTHKNAVPSLVNFSTTLNR